MFVVLWLLSQTRRGRAGPLKQYDEWRRVGESLKAFKDVWETLRYRVAETHGQEVFTFQIKTPNISPLDVRPPCKLTDDHTTSIYLSGCSRCCREAPTS